MLQYPERFPTKTRVEAAAGGGGVAIGVVAAIPAPVRGDDVSWKNGWWEEWSVGGMVDVAAIPAPCRGGDVAPSMRRNEEEGLPGVLGNERICYSRGCSMSALPHPTSLKNIECPW